MVYKRAKALTVSAESPSVKHKNSTRSHGSQLGMHLDCRLLRKRQVYLLAGLSIINYSVIKNNLHLEFLMTGRGASVPPQRYFLKLTV